MQIDQYTYLDLSIFHPEEEYSVFHRLNFTRTFGGKDYLMRYFRQPFDNVDKIRETQRIIQLILERVDQWPMGISNGTMLVIDRFYDYQLDPLPESANIITAYTYRILHSPDYSLVNFSIGHFADFVRTLKELIALFDDIDLPKKMQQLLERARKLLNYEIIHEIAKRPKDQRYEVAETVYYGYYFHTIFKPASEVLLEIYSQFDAWYSMAMAVKTFHLQFPDFVDSEDPYFEAEGLYHLLLQQPVPYDVKMNIDSNFIFLTGANMAGKSTFIKSIGLNIFLAHIGLGVPAKSMKLSLFDGILSNINVTDNIVKGESFFYNEVQRIKNTVVRINDGRKWLVLIDELFKGTNIQDAMKCSTTVIRGLINIRHALFVLSTHLYEIGEELKPYPNISFKYFETVANEHELEFSYQLKDGISNDRIGYLILQREGVVEILEGLGR
ncbi:MAG: MutS-related protein [Sphingobacteriales bacterium]